LFDEVVDITVEGMPPGERAEVRVSMEWDGYDWEGSAVYEATDKGVIDPNDQDPVDGSREADTGMALFQFMDRRGETDTDDRWRADTTVSVVLDGDVVDERQFYRYVKTDSVSVRVVDHDWVVGDYYEPTDVDEAPGVVVLGGSEGGIPFRRGSVITAPLLASRGFAVLDLAYFGAEGLSDSLIEIPGEYFEAALWWLTNQPTVIDDWLSVFGTSRGAEIALYLGTNVSEVRNVISYSGSPVLYQGIPDGPESPGAPLQYEDEPVSYIRNKIPPRLVLGLLWKVVRGKAFEPRQLYERGLNRASDEEVENATIPVENVGGPILFVSGSDDPVWNSARLSSIGLEQLDDKYEYPVEAQRHEGAGHMIREPFTPTTYRQSSVTFLPRVPLAVGDTPAEYAVADVQAWETALDHLEWTRQRAKEAPPIGDDD
jgi:hypothetical protein